MRSALDLERERMLAQLLEEHHQRQSAEDVLRQARISHGSTMSFHISSSYNSQPKPSLVRLQYGNMGGDGDDDDVECITGEVQSLAPGQLPKSITVKPTPRFGSLTLAGAATPAPALASTAFGDAAAGLRPPSGGVRAAAAAVAGSGGAAGCPAGAGNAAEPQEVASNKWTVAPFPTRFLWTSLPPVEMDAAAGNTPDATSPTGNAALASSPSAGPPQGTGAAPVPSPPRAEASYGAAQRSRMRRMSATEAGMQAPPSQRYRTPGVVASIDGSSAGAGVAGVTLSTGQLVIPSVPSASSRDGAACGPSGTGSPPLAAGAAGAGGPAARATDTPRGGRFKSHGPHPANVVSTDTAAAAGDQNKAGRLSTSGLKEPPPHAMPASRERLPAPPTVRGGRDPTGHRSWTRMSGAGADPGSDTESLSVARSGASLTVGRSGASFTNLQQQARMRGSVPEGIGTGSGAALRPTPLSLPGQSGAAAAPNPGHGSSPGASSSSPPSLAAAAGLQPPPPAQEMPMRAPSGSHLGTAPGGAPVDANALSLLSRVTRVQPKPPPPQEWKVDPRTLIGEMVAAVESGGAGGSGSTGLGFGPYGFLPARPQTGASWGSRKGTADGGATAGRPLSPGAEGTLDFVLPSGARTAPVHSVAFEDGEGVQRAASGEHPAAPCSAAGDSPSGGAAAGRSSVPRQLPALVSARTGTPPPMHVGASGGGVRVSARGSNPRGAVLAPDERAPGAALPPGSGTLPLRATMSPARARPGPLATTSTSLSQLGQPPVASPPKQAPQPPPAGAPLQHPLSSGRHRAQAGSQGSGGVGSAASSFTAGHQETVELRRARLIALGEKERPMSPTGGGQAQAGAMGGPAGEGGAAAGTSSSSSAAAAPSSVAVAAAGRLPGLAGKQEARAGAGPAGAQANPRATKADLRGSAFPKDGGGSGEGGGGEASNDEHESIMMRMKKALSFLRRGD